MSFRNDVQLARCCEALCARIHKGQCWTTSPAQATAFAIDVKEDRVGLSSGERLIVLAAWAFWNGDSTLRFGDLLAFLSADHLEAIFSLALAAAAPGGEAVDAWLAKHEPIARSS